MGTTGICSKCNKDHDLSLAQCPSPARVLPPTGPKPSPSTETKRVEAKAEEPAKVELPKLSSMQADTIAETKMPPAIPKKTASSVNEATLVEAKAESKPKIEATIEEPAEALKAPIKMPTPPPSVMPVLVAPKEEIPSNTKSSSPSLEALAATLETNKPAIKSEPRKETMIGSADALVMPPQTAKDKALGLYQGKVAPMIKGREKIVAGVAGGLVLLLIAVIAFGGDDKPVVAPSVQPPTQNSPLFASQPTEPSSEETNIEGGEEGPAVEPGGMVPIEVNVNPTDAVIVVWVDGAVFKTGASPLSVEVPSGSSVEVTLAAAGYTPEQKTFKAKGKKTIKESLNKLGSGGGNKTSNTGTKKNNNSGGGWGGWGGK